MDIVPSLHSFKSLQLKFGRSASWPITAIVLIRAAAMGSPRTVTPDAAPVVVLRLFFRSTADAPPISRTSAVCAAERTSTWRFREPLPSECCASKFTDG
jgi:hypothetical protein